MANDNDSNDTMITAGAIGGGALLLWYLLRGRGLLGGKSGGRAGAPTIAVTPDASTPARSPCNVFMRGSAIELDGAASDLSTVVATCRVVGTAHLRASGETTQGRVIDVARALNREGVAILAHGDISDVVRDALVRTA